MRILIVDDSPDFTAMVAALAREAGHEVHVAFSGQQGIAEAATHTPDVAFIDLTLPDVPGWDVAAAIARTAAGPAPILIACSGHDPADPSVRDFLPRFSDYVLKGRASLEALERAIHRASEQVSRRVHS